MWRNGFIAAEAYKNITLFDRFCLEMSFFFLFYTSYFSFPLSNRGQENKKSFLLKTFGPQAPSLMKVKEMKKRNSLHVKVFQRTKSIWLPQVRGNLWSVKLDFFSCFHHETLCPILAFKHNTKEEQGTNSRHFQPDSSSWRSVQSCLLSSLLESSTSPLVSACMSPLTTSETLRLITVV